MNVGLVLCSEFVEVGEDDGSLVEVEAGFSAELEVCLSTETPCVLEESGGVEEDGVATDSKDDGDCGEAADNDSSLLSSSIFELGYR